MPISDEEFMGRWFSRVTKPQLAVYNQRMSDAAPYRNAPRWERARAAAQNEFQITTKEVRDLYERGMADLMTLGEVSEESNDALTAFENIKLVPSLQAAE